jgi:hypothetical protein
MTKYNVKYEIAKIYLDNLTYIEDIEYKNDKLLFLSLLKKELLTNNLISINKLFLSTLVNKEIEFYNLPISKEIEHLISLLSENNKVSIKQDELKSYSHTIYELQTIEDEVEYIVIDNLRDVDFNWRK